MDPGQRGTVFAPGAAGKGSQRQGSVRRAREMLEASGHSETQTYPPVDALPEPLAVRNEDARLTRWPLPEDQDEAPSMPHLPAKSFVPKVPPPPMPPLRPSDTPASSIYSERGAPWFAATPRHTQEPLPPLPHPLPHQPPPRHVAEEFTSYPTNSSGVTHGKAREYDRQSAASSVGTIPDFPLPQDPNPAHLHSQYNNGEPIRKSSISPILEESRDGSTTRGGSFASSKVIRSSWASGPAESDILGAYLDGRSDNGRSGRFTHDDNDALLRQASLGKRGKPSLRTIQKSNPSSYVSQEQGNHYPMPKMEDTDGRHASNSTTFRDSSSSGDSASPNDLDLEKSQIFLEVPLRRPGASHDADTSGKEQRGLPRSGPKMSDIRPNAPRPPRLDLGVTRNAETRGSLTSLTDLIKRATRLATRLDHGRTASKAELWDDTREVRPPFGQRGRTSVSLSDILASFPHPNPGPGGMEAHSPWPVPSFFKRHTQRHTRSNDMLPTIDEKPQRRCCGMRPGMFIFVLIVVIIVVALVILLPVFLVAVPKERAANEPLCEKKVPCGNGGVSVSSGTMCSCVCTNGFTGSKCMVEGDRSCVTVEVSGQNATMGSDLPRLFENSQNDFSILLDSFSLMALFSQNNVSCMTENILVSFPELPNKTKRFFMLPEMLDPFIQASQPVTIEKASIPTPVLAARDSVATVNGILIDGTPETTRHNHLSTTTGAPTATHTNKNPSVTSAATTTAASSASASALPSSTSLPITNKRLDFARVAVLYLFQQTGVLDATIKFSDNIQTFLTGPFSSGKTQEFKMNLIEFGLLANYTVNFEAFTIDLGAGGTVGSGFVKATSPS